MKYFQLHIKNTLKKLSAFLPVVFVLLCSSCFTGIESTKKIHLSKEDKKLATPTPEEALTAHIQGVPLKEWDPGKSFMMADDKAIYVIVPTQGLVAVAPDSVKGNIIRFESISSRMNPAGLVTVSLLFTDGAYLYTYETGKEFDDAMENLLSNQIPMLIDLNMVESAKELLGGKQVWTRSPLWYDNKGNRIEGRKFEKVTIIDVLPGDMVFPLSLKIRTDNGDEAFMYMNYGNADNESRAFHNLFSLSDPKKHYPDIDPEIWKLISMGQVAIGMTKEECKLALGNPSEITSGHDYSQTIDIWTYDNGRVLWFEDGRLARIRQ